MPVVILLVLELKLVIAARLAGQSSLVGTVYVMALVLELELLIAQLTGQSWLVFPFLVQVMVFWMLVVLELCWEQ